MSTAIREICSTSVKRLPTRLSTKPVVKGTASLPIRLLFITLWLALAACTVEPPTSASSAPTVEPGSVFFPTQEQVNGEWIRLTGEMTGEIVEANGCLRLNASHADAGYLIIWPPGYTFDASETQIHIRDETGRIVATTGETVQMGGGGGSSLEGQAGVSEQLLREIPSDCPGPYWISAGIISSPMNESE